MNSIDKILHYLDTTSRVSCPQITCEQAAEIAAIIRWITERQKELVENGATLNLVEWIECKSAVARVSELEGLLLRTEQSACGFAFDAGLEMERQFLKYRDCGQDGVCGFSPGCNRHWEERNRELGKSLLAQNEATGDIDPGIYEGTGKGFEK